MTVYHFNLAYTSGWSGGDQCTLETLKYFARRKIDNVHITTEKGREGYIKRGASEVRNLRYLIVPDFASTTSGLPLFWAYIMRARAALRMIKDVQIEEEDAIICHNDFFVNSIPCHQFAKQGERIKIIYWVHMLAPSLFKGYRGEFTNRFTVPSPALIHFKLSQCLLSRLMLPQGIVLSNNPCYKDRIQRLFPKCECSIAPKYSGVEDKFRPFQPSEEFDYDLVWLGRFHPQKGLFDLIRIAEIMVEEKPNLRIGIIGNGPGRIGEQFQCAVRTKGLEENMHLLGALFGEEKYLALRRGKVYMMSSYYEGYCNVYVEALSQGVPVVAYDLPVHAVFMRGSLKVPVGDTEAMAKTALDLLRNEEKRQRLAREALAAGQEHRWEIVGEHTYNLLFD